MHALLTTIPAWIWVLLSLVGLLITGFVTLARRAVDIDVRYQSAGDFRSKFLLYANSRGQDQGAYHWLILQSNKMQREMGHHGIMGQFRDPPFIYTNYPIILNMLPRLRRPFTEANYFNRCDELAKMLDETLIRHLGSLIGYKCSANTRVRNPLHWFLCGVEQVISVPIYFFQIFGVMSRITVSAIQRSRLFKIVSALIMLLGLIASV